MASGQWPVASGQWSVVSESGWWGVVPDGGVWVWLRGEKGEEGAAEAARRALAAAWVGAAARGGG